MTHDEIRIAVLTMPIAELRERTAALCYFGVPLPDDDVDVVGAPLTPNDNDEDIGLDDDDDAKVPLNGTIANVENNRRVLRACLLAKQGLPKSRIAAEIRGHYGGSWSDARLLAADVVDTLKAAKSNGLDATA